MEKLRHKHHIVPKYMGGTDDTNNLAEVTITQHAMFHYCNYQLWGNTQDYIAWRGLTESISQEEIIQEKLSLAGKKGNKRCKELGIGLYGLTFEQRSEYGKQATKRAKELGVGVYGLTKEQLSENGRKSGNMQKELGLGCHSLTSEQKSENGKKGDKRCKELGVGLYGLTFEQRSENTKRLQSQKWMCIETEFISGPSGLTRYQNKRGIDTSKRIRLS
jgi:hypothetical protein